MPLRFALAACLLAAACLPAPADEKKPDADEGWIPLFDGKDLAGWKMADPPSGDFKSVKAVKGEDGKVAAYVRARRRRAPRSSSGKSRTA